MAYKFQLGAAVLSGSAKFEDGLVATDVDDTTAANIVAEIDNGEIPIAKLAAKTISGKDLGQNLDALAVDDSSIEYSAGSAYNGSAASTIRVKALGITNGMLAGSIANAKLANSTISGVALGGNLNSLSKASDAGLALTSYNGSAAVSDLAIDFTDLADGTINVAEDSFVFADATDGGSKVDSVADLMTAVAGDGLAASSGVLAVGVDDSSIELNSDALRVKALGVTNAMLAGSIANAKLANSAITIAGTSTSLGGSITAATILNTDMGGNFTIGNQSDDTATFTGGVIVSGDLTVSGTTTTVNSTTINITSSLTFEGPADDHETTLGVVAPTADATINLPAMSAGTYHLPVLAAASTDAINATPAEINAIADASARSAAAVDVSADHFMFCDGGATGAYKVESIADLATAMAGDGLAAASGVFAVGVDDSSIELNSDALRIKASGVTNAMLAGSIADDKLNTISTAGKVALSALEIDGESNAVTSLDAADLFIVDDGAGGSNKKMAASVLKTFIGSGVSPVTVIGDENATLAVGINAPSAAASAQRTWTLPASENLTAGESIIIKAYGNSGTHPVTVAVNSGQEIDGVEANIVLESDSAAVTLYYVAADTFIIV